MKNKKGLSQIVSTLIFLILVLVAVAIIWGIVKTVIKNNAEKVSLDTITLDLTIESVNIMNDTGVIVNVERHKGKGDFKGIKFIFDNGEASEIIQVNYALKELEQRDFIFNLQILNASELETVSIAPVFETASGKEITGNIQDVFRIKRGQYTVNPNPPGCTDTCLSLGYECGTFVICEMDINCGDCTSYGPTYTCNVSGLCQGP